MEESKSVAIAVEEPVSDEKRAEERFDTIDYVRELFLLAVDQKKSDQKKLRLLQLCAAALALTTVCLILFCAVLLPKVVSTLDEATKTLHIAQGIDVNKLLTNIDGFIAEAEVSLTKVGDAASVLNGIDMTTLNDAIAKLDTGADSLLGIDVVSLNAAIKNLNDTIEPLAKLFGRSR